MSIGFGEFDLESDMRIFTPENGAALATHLNDNGVVPAHTLNEKKFVFAGNRAFVLDEMIARNLDVEVLAVRDSHLEADLQQRHHPYTAICDKKHLISCLESMAYDVFVANGCPHILPISRLQDGGRIFVNVHPGPLPDLRGIDPVPGALLLGRDSGAACHLMDDGIDTGPVISRVVIPSTQDLDAGLLYQLSFLAEKEAFTIAYERAFQPLRGVEFSSHSVYYSKNAQDLRIDFNDPAEAILRRIKAFSNRSQGARFSYNGVEFRVFDAEQVVNPYLMNRRGSYREGEVVFRYEDCLLVRKGEAFLKLKAIEGDLSTIQPGDILTGAPSETQIPLKRVPAI